MPCLVTDLRAFARIADFGCVLRARDAEVVGEPLAGLAGGGGRRCACGALDETPAAEARGAPVPRRARGIVDDVGEAENAIIGLIGAPRDDPRVSVPFNFACFPAREKAGRTTHIGDVADAIGA